MAQTLDKDLNIIQKSGVEIQIDPLTKDLSIIQKLDDEPNDVGGLSAQELKAKFDEAGNVIKEYINDSLIPQVVGDGLSEQDRQKNEARRQAAESAREAAETAREAAETARVAAETAREAAEAARAEAEAAREAAFALAQDQRAEVFEESQEARTVEFDASQADREVRFEAGEERRNLWEGFDPAKAYAPGNKVYYLGSSFVNIAPCSGISPYDDAHWQMIAKKGADGDGATPFDYALSAGFQGTEDAFKGNFAKAPWLPLAGGTMAGPLAVPYPAADDHSANKGYADSLVNGFAWTRGEFLTARNRYGLCYGNGIFVTVPLGDNYANYSIDGINWVNTPLPFVSLWTDVCFGNGMFVAVTRGDSSAAGIDKAAYSTDGIHWVETTMPTTTTWNRVCYGNGMFVAASDRAAAYSTDGINWTASTFPGIFSIDGMCFGVGKFVIVGGRTNTVLYSTDGINWSSSKLPSHSIWRGICYGNGRFVVAAQNSNAAAYSTDAVNWTASTFPSGNGSTSICYGDGRFFAIEYSQPKVAYSADGVNWEETDLPASGFVICYGEQKLVTVNFNRSACANSIVVRDTIKALETRKLELIPVLDISVTLTTETSWKIDLREMHLSERMAVFFFFTMPDSKTYTLNYGSSTSGRVVWFYGKNAGFMGVPLRMPDMPVTLLPLGGVQEVTPKSGYTYKALDTLTVYNYTVNTAMPGTFRFQGFVIP
ncbi:MAG: hypothetical protein HFF90_12975 [Oscillibacter sp.]|nr:hypothetical protein [Oscillibacter sp.]